MNLNILDGLFAIHRLPNNADCPKDILSGDFFSISKTEDELSIVCDENIKLESSKVDKGWACIKVAGPLDFAVTGILARISTTLAVVGISIFAISTYDTDYILVKKENIDKAKNALLNKGYIFV